MLRVSRFYARQATNLLAILGLLTYLLPDERKTQLSLKQGMGNRGESGNRVKLASLATVIF